MRTPEHYQRIKEIIVAASECQPDQRAAYLDQACAGDASLRAEVEVLLANQEAAKNFMEAPPLGRVTSDGQSQGKVVGGRYSIEQELGRGGMGVVFLAHDQRLNQKPVVIKVLQESFLDPKIKAWVEKKFKQEIEALARINHPGVVRALDVGRLPDGRTYLVMEFVQGVNLRSLILPNGMPLTQVARLIRQIGQALAAAHAQYVFHRDLKPENILLHTEDDEEQAKLIDFGIASVLDSAEQGGVKTRIAGTPDYMAPEQLQGNPAAASDIYALGVLAYEMVTGRLPFKVESQAQLLELQRAGVRVKPCDLRPELPADAQTVILKALSFDQRNRYASAKDFADALAQALTIKVKETPSLELELAHVLFTDLVGYSKLTVDEQKRLLEQLQVVVSTTATFQRSQASGRLISLPTGDGIALVFFEDPLAPVNCAVEIARALKSLPEIKLRMGINTGSVKRIAADISQKPNVSGPGINFAQRVMDCGIAGHILLSKTVADVLSQTSEWAAHLKDWGERRVKHGVKVHIFNLYTGEVGNPARSKPAKLWLLLIAALLAVGSVGAFAWLHYTTAPKRILSYSLTVQKDPNSKPFPLPGEMIFPAEYQVRLHISSPQVGYLYANNTFLHRVRNSDGNEAYIARLVLESLFQAQRI